MALVKGVYHRENQKIHLKFEHMIKAYLILKANTATYSLAQYNIE